MKCCHFQGHSSLSVDLGDAAMSSFRASMLISLHVKAIKVLKMQCYTTRQLHPGSSEAASPWCTHPFGSAGSEHAQTANMRPSWLHTPQLAYNSEPIGTGVEKILIICQGLKENQTPGGEWHRFGSVLCTKSQSKLCKSVTQGLGSHNPGCSSCCNAAFPCFQNTLHVST